VNVFNDAIETHVQWKTTLKKQVEDGLPVRDVKDVASCHVCELGRWIYGEGIRYNRLPSFESMCSIHEHFHRVAGEVVRHVNSGDRVTALALLKPDGLFAQSSAKLVKSLLECGRELAGAVVKGVRISGRVGDVLRTKASDVIHSIDGFTALSEALKVMVGHNIGALVVYHEGEFRGIFTERGYARNMVRMGLAALEIPIAELVDTDTISVDPDDSIEQCMTLMTSTHKRHLPVIRDGKVAGIISIGDVIKQVVAEDRENVSQLEDYIHGHYGVAL
jgi:CBS domain-containing protein